MPAILLRIARNSPVDVYELPPQKKRQQKTSEQGQSNGTTVAEAFAAVEEVDGEEGTVGDVAGRQALQERLQIQFFESLQR